jgi:TolB-like protein/DNA-binding winged helix-turn-helix (wHTH) protein/Flp pilus assembly protein TadD
LRPRFFGVAMISDRVKTADPIRFGEDFELDVRAYELRRAGRVLKLERIPMELLLLLIEQKGQLVARDQIVQRIWGKDVFLDTDNSINAAVRKIRQVLKDDPEKPRFVQTITGRGYRFIASIREPDVPPAVDREPLQQATVVAPAPSPASTQVTSQSPHWLRTPRGLIPVSAVLLFVALAVAYYIRRTNAVDSPQTLAVLPFRPLSTGAGDEYLELGMADALITKLSRSGRLIVRPTSAIRKYTAPDTDVLAAGRALQVDSILEGNIQRADDRLRVSLRLLRVRDGASLWSDSYDTKFTDVFRVQDTVSERVVEALAVQLSTPQKAGLRKRDTANLQAYELYMRGVFFWNKRNEDGLRKAVSYFEQAVALDENYALAHAGLAAALCPLGYGGYSTPEEVHSKMRAAATRAVSLDPDLPEGHVALGALLAFYEWNWSEGEKEFQRALTLNPNLSLAHHWYAMLMECLGRFQDALKERQRAQELDPITPIYLVALGQTLYRVADNERALTELQKALELDNSLDIAHIGIAEIYERRGDYARALAEYRLAVKYSPGSRRARAALAYALGQAGATREAKQILSEMIAASHQQYVSPVHLAMIYVGVHDKEAALNWLTQAYDRHDPALCDVLRQLRFQSLYTDPRFKTLLDRMRLPAPD